MTAISDDQKVDARRFCGYPVYGANPGGTLSSRFFQAYGLFEYRIANLSDTEAGVVGKYLVTLSKLEQAVTDAGANLDTDQASVWVHNKSEIADRLQLFDEWRRRLCEFVGVPAGPFLTSKQVSVIV